MTDFMRGVLMNKDVIEVFKDVSGFRDVIMKPYNPPAPSPSPKQCSVSLKHQLSSSSCNLQTPSFGCKHFFSHICFDMTSLKISCTATKFSRN